MDYEEYKKIGFVVSPLFNYQSIYFNEKGFRHLIYKKGNRRHHKDFSRKLILLTYAQEILVSGRVCEKREIITLDKEMVRFWSVIKKFKNGNVTVIVRQIGEKEKHFFSIMSEFK